MLERLKKDLPFLQNKYHDTAAPFNAFHRMAYHGWPGDPATGYDDSEMEAGLTAFVDSLPEEPHAVTKARAFAYVLDHMRIGIDEHDYFPLLYNWNRPLRKLLTDPWQKACTKSEETRAYLDRYTPSGDVSIRLDYDHSVPDWHVLYALGFPGILARAKAYRAEREAASPLTADEAGYFDGIEITYDAILRLIARMRDYAAGLPFARAKEIADCLARLHEGPPETMYEQLMLIFLYWFLSESIDVYQVRSLGSGLDHDLLPLYTRDLESGRYTAEELDEFIGYFLMQFSAIGNYWGQPVYLGGSNIDGSCKVNAVSYRILAVYDELGIYNPKFQIKYNAATPDRFLQTILDMIRRGHSSFVFICEDTVRRHMVERGIPAERAWDFDVKGCYEYSVRGGEFPTAPFYLNLMSSLLRALDEADDDAAYDDIVAAFYANLDAVIRGGIKVCNELEKNLGQINPANMLSATIEHSLKVARDAYLDGSEYNTSAFWPNGFATTVDSLMAIRQLVYIQQVCTLAELKQVLADNWSDPALRARAKSLPQKFGCGDPEADACAKELSAFLLQYQGLPNSRGGYYKAEMHSARNYLGFGKRLKASPDGRLKGEETSKNASPVQGMDRNGVTGVIRSALALEPGKYWEGFGLDLMLHETAVKGEAGMQALLTLLRTYDAAGGSSVQFNIFDANTLRDAQQNPEKYQNLQVRVCGWNTLWRDMPKVEQDKFIERAEALA